MIRQHLRSAVALVSLITLSAAARATGDFTFRDAEFLPVDRGIEAAQDFVATRLPPGLPLSDALARLRHADMRCRKTRRDGATVCDFAEVVHVEGGVLGENHWTVRLTADASGKLAAATLDHFTIGAGNAAP